MDALISLVTDPLMVPGLLVLLAVGIAYEGRNRLELGPFTLGDDLPKAFKSLTEAVKSEMRRVLQTHQRVGVAAGELSLARDVSLASMSESIDIDEQVKRAAEKKTLPLLQVLLTLIRYLARPPRIRGSVTKSRDKIWIRATYWQRGQGPICSGSAGR